MADCVNLKLKLLSTHQSFHEKCKNLVVIRDVKDSGGKKTVDKLNTLKQFFFVSSVLTMAMTTTTLIMSLPLLMEASSSSRERKKSAASGLALNLNKYQLVIISLRF